MCSFVKGRRLSRQVTSGEPTVGKGQRHTEAMILALVALVKVEPDAQALQVRVRVR